MVQAGVVLTGPVPGGVLPFGVGSTGVVRSGGVYSLGTHPLANRVHASLHYDSLVSPFVLYCLRAISNWAGVHVEQ